MSNLPVKLYVRDTMSNLSSGLYDTLHGVTSSLIAKYPLIADLTDTVNGYLAVLTRSTVKTFADDDGFMPTVGVDTAAFTGSGILLEPPSTTQIPYSNDLTNAVWGKSNLTPTHNDVTGPDGTLSAGTITCTSNVDGANELSVGTVSALPAGTYYMKMIVGAGTVNHIIINCWNLALTTAAGYWFNINTGTVGTYNGGGGGWSATASIRALDEGFFECTMVVTTADNGMYVYAYPSQSDSTHTQSIGDSIKFYNLSIQENDTSPIINPSATAKTRTVDDLAFPTTNFPAVDFSFYFHINTPATVTDQYLFVDRFDADNYITVISSGGQVEAYIVINTVVTTCTIASALAANTSYDFMLRIGVVETKLFMNAQSGASTGVAGVTHAANCYLAATISPAPCNVVASYFKIIPDVTTTLAEAIAL